MSQNDNRIFTLMLEPHGGCNIRCSHCYYDIQNKSIMRIEDFTLVIEKVASYIKTKGFNELHFIWHGGEPLLAGIDFFQQAMEIIDKTISQFRKRHFIQTNGLLLDEEFCNFFRNMNVEVGVSLDGPKDLHDQLRVDLNGHGTHAMVMEKIKLLEKHHVPVGFNTVISRASLGSESRIYELFSEMGYGFRINPIIPGRNPDKNKEYLLGKGEYGKFLCGLFDIWTQKDKKRVEISPLTIYLRSVMNGETSECQHQQTCVGTHLGIRPSGEAVLCNRFQDHKIGNILEMSMEEIFSSLTVQQIKKRVDALDDCQSCDNGSICHGGCPSNSVAYGQGPLVKDPFCSDYKIIFDHIQRVLKNYNLNYPKYKQL